MGKQLMERQDVNIITLRLMSSQSSLLAVTNFILAINAMKRRLDTKLLSGRENTSMNRPFYAVCVNQRLASMHTWIQSSVRIVMQHSTQDASCIIIYILNQHKEAVSK
jgi:hypothetical protein